MSKAAIAGPSGVKSATRAPSAHRGLHIVNLVFSVAAVAGMAVMMWGALLYARPAANLVGDEQTAQRIFYLHMGCNFAVLGAFTTSLVASIAYLITRRLDWDRLAQASITAWNYSA